MSNFNEHLHVLANFWYYDDQYPNILSCKQSIIDDILKDLYCADTLIVLKQSAIGLYIHIPFCKTQCLYCDCTVKVSLNEAEHAKYIDCISKEAYNQYITYGKKIPVETIYIWWGTPSLLSIENIKRLFNIIGMYYDLSSTQQITFEASPYTLTEEKIDLLKQEWVNRLTFGVQTFEESVLERYNRPQKENETLWIILYAKKSWIPYINIDIIAGMPWQTVGGFLYTLKVIDKYIRPTSMVVHPFQPTLRTPFSRLKKEYSKKDIALRKVLRNISTPFTNNITNASVYSRAKNQQLYDISYSYKSVIWLGYWAITSIPWKVKFYWKDLSSYYDYFLLKKNTEWLYSIFSKYSDIETSYILRVLTWEGLNKSEFKNIFWHTVEDTDFYKAMQESGFNWMFKINDYSITYSPNVTRIQKMEFFFKYINKYPINTEITDAYKNSWYQDLYTFFDY